MKNQMGDGVATDSADRVRYFEKHITQLPPALPGVTHESYTNYIHYQSFLMDHDVCTERDGRLDGYLSLAVGEDGEDLVLGMLVGVGMPKSFLDKIVEDFRAKEILCSGVEIIEAYLQLSSTLTEEERRGWKDLQEALLGRRSTGNGCQFTKEERPGPHGSSPGIPSGENPEGLGQE